MELLTTRHLPLFKFLSLSSILRHVTDMVLDLEGHIYVKGHVTTTRPFSGKFLATPARLTKFEVPSSSSFEDMFNRMPKI